MSEATIYKPTILCESLVKSFTYKEQVNKEIQNQYDELLLFNRLTLLTFPVSTVAGK